MMIPFAEPRASEIGTRILLGQQAFARDRSAIGTGFATRILLGDSARPSSSGFVPHWAFVRRRFEFFLENLKITANQAENGETNQRGVVACLNRAYWNSGHETANRLLIGSWGKQTRVRPPRDIDILFTPPVDVYWRFQRRSGNRQSQLLQEMRAVLRETYYATDISGDGQVVVVPLNYTIEIAPAFHREGGGFLACDTNNGGRYKHTDPVAEIAALDAADRQFNGNVRKLTRVLKQWQRHCKVPIKSFQLEALVKEMLALSGYGAKDEFWFDWLTRDAFAHMIGRANGWFHMPATGEMIFLGDEWLSRAESAYARAWKACEFEHDNYEALAGEEWQKIFGTMIPVTMG